MTRFLFDTLTPKQARIAAELYKTAAKMGIDIVITCRDYLHLIDMLKLYGVPYRCIGKYGADLAEKLRYGLERQLALMELAKDVVGMVGFPSPDATRVVFGLGKPIVILNDTPHADAVNRLTIPLSRVLITPQAIPTEAWRPYCPRRVVTFDGVFEYMWTSKFVPERSVVEKLGLAPGEYIVFRPEESHASYYRWDARQLRRRLIREVASKGFKVVYVPRYPDQVEEGVINLTTAVDHLQLAYFSAGVITGGATMATEAALLGVPSLSYFPQDFYIDLYLQSKGAPLYRCRDEHSCVESLRQMLEAKRNGILRLEDPSDIILEELKRP